MECGDERSNSPLWLRLFSDRFWKQDRPDVTIEAGRAVPYFEVVSLPVKTIQDWLDGKAPNYGWVFAPGGTGGADFDSLESATPSFRPLLSITIGTSGEPTLSSVRPANDAIDVPVNSNIEFTITEDTLKVNPSSVQLFKSIPVPKHTPSPSDRDRYSRIKPPPRRGARGATRPTIAVRAKADRLL